ncbi:MAG: hypothetical protein ABW061_04215 [Polyangiaceae bacterium]
MTASRNCWSLLVLGAVLFAPPLRAQAATPTPTPTPTRSGPVISEPPRLNDTAELARVVSLYEAGKYGECADSFHDLLSPEGAHPLHDLDVIESARIYHAACLIGSGQNQLADEPLRAAIRQNPQMKAPDSLVFPPQVIDRFLRVRETMFDIIRRAEDERVHRAQELAKQQEERARKERARVAALERLAQQETLITPKTRWLALVPFGVGQFQNGEKSLGYVFLTSEVLLAATTLTALGVETHLVLATSRADKPEQSINGTLSDWNTALLYSSYAWLGVSVIGIVQAQLAFVPEQRQIRKRALPPELRPETSGLSLMPSAIPVTGGAVFGLSGRF